MQQIELEANTKRQAYHNLSEFLGSISIENTTISTKEDKVEHWYPNFF